MALSPEEKQAIKNTLRQYYQQIGPTGADVKGCWKRDPQGNITGQVDLGCLRNAGSQIGSKVKQLWGK